MNSPLTYPDQLRDDNLMEFFLKQSVRPSRKTCLRYWLGSSTPFADLRPICSGPPT